MTNPLFFVSTDDSMHEGYGSAKEYVAAAKKAGICELVLHDTCSTQSFVEFYKQCKAQDVKPLLGLRVNVESPFNLIVVLRKYRHLGFFLSSIYRDKFSINFGIQDFDNYLIQNNIYEAEKLGRVLKALSDDLSDFIQGKVNLKRSQKLHREILQFFELDKDFVSEEDFSSYAKSTYEDMFTKGFGKEGFLLAFKSMSEIDRAQDISSISLMAKNDLGALNLREIVSLCFIGSKNYLKKDDDFGRGEFPSAKIEYIHSKSSGLVFNIFDLNSIFGKLSAYGLSNYFDAALNYYCVGFDSVVVSLAKRTTSGIDDDKVCDLEERVCSDFISLANRHGIPLVAAHDVRYAKKSDLEAADVRAMILLDQNEDVIGRRPHFFANQFFREDASLFFVENPDVVDNARILADNSTVEADLGNFYLPRFDTPSGVSEEDWLRKISKDGLSEYIENRKRHVDAIDVDVELYFKRLEYELDIIISMGFAGYFLIVQDFINWAKENRVPVGPGRGSGAGSIVALSLGITGVDPIEHGLIFERFLNPERVSMPDFDIDFGDGALDDGGFIGRSDVISYVEKKYNKKGSEFPYVAVISTKGTLKIKSAIKDVTRVFGNTPSLPNKISKWLDNIVGETDMNVKVSSVKELLEDYPDLRLEEVLASNKRLKKIFGLTEQLAGRKKSSGVHAAGVVIGEKQLTTYSPLIYDNKNKRLAVQYDKNSAEDAGLVKFDFLGLDTLSVISLAEKYIREITDKDFVIDKISWRDADTFKMYSSSLNQNIFQVESVGMQKLFRSIKPTDLGEVSDIIALFRPGPLQSEMDKKYIDRKYGRESIDCYHENLNYILEPTKGVIIYQEQVMKIAQEMSGYTLGGADILRRAMGKKKPEEMEKQSKTFLEGAKGRGYPEDLARRVFDDVEKFAGYGFNKSHSLAYAVVSYQTAYLKTHYKKEYMASVMTYAMDTSVHEKKLQPAISHARRIGITVIPPDINKSDVNFTPLKTEDSILFGLGGIRGVGNSAPKIVKERERGGEYLSIPNIMLRLGKTLAKKTVIEGLIFSGALDDLSVYDSGVASNIYEKREVLWREYEFYSKVFPKADVARTIARKHEKPLYLPRIEKLGKSKKVEILDPTKIEDAVNPEVPSVLSTNVMHILSREKNYSSSYLTMHPFDVDNVRERLGANTKLHNVSEVLSAYDDCLREFEKDPDVFDKCFKSLVKVGGVINNVREIIVKNGDSAGEKMAVVSVDDGTGEVSIAVFVGAYKKIKDYLVVGDVVAFKGRVSYNEERDMMNFSCSEFAALLPSMKIFPEEALQDENKKRKRAKGFSRATEA